MPSSQVNDFYISAPLYILLLVTSLHKTPYETALLDLDDLLTQETAEAVRQSWD